MNLRFTDLPGLWQHISYPMSQLSVDSFEEGFGIDAVSPMEIRLGTSLGKSSYGRYLLTLLDSDIKKMGYDTALFEAVELVKVGKRGTRL